MTRVLPLALVGLAAAIVSTGALARAAPAGADGPSSLGALQAEVVAEARVVHYWAASYEYDAARVDYLKAQRATDLTELTTARHQLSRQKTLLQQQATLAYTGGLANSGPAAQDPGASMAEVERANYENLVMGDLSQTLSGYETDRANAAVAAKRYDTELRAGLSALRAAANAWDAALSEATRLQQMLDQARAREAELAAARENRASTGLPVGGGVVAAVAGQLIASSGSGFKQGPRSTGSAPPTRAVTVAVGPPSAGGANTSTAVAGPMSTSPTATPAAATRPATTTVPATTVAATTLPLLATPATTVPTTAPPATTTTAAAASGEGSDPPPAGGVWLELRECESGDNYQEDTGNGFYGAYQFAASTWTGLGYPGRPDLEPYWLQDEAAEHLEAVQGWGPWPACSAALGL
ncbi:MAG TPA: transglycosylase family protein [Acidimicrobiales bacterium]|nr:transglycosylase family protein [Acidimicrobiales bacterium]